MSSIIIKKVKSKRDLGRFIDFHYDLYEGCEQDVPNLFSDEMKTLDKERNAAFEFCEAEYFMAFYKDGGRMAGRVRPRGRHHQPQGQQAVGPQVRALRLARLR